MDPFIQFRWEGLPYECPPKAYVLGKIVLPDGRVLIVESWLESNPPQPRGMHLSEEAYTGTPEEIAEKVGGVVAEENLVAEID